MMKRMSVGLCVLVGSAGLAMADVGGESLDQKVQRLEKLVNTQQSQIANLQAQQGQSWLNNERADQVKQLVREVLSDADTRASLMDSAITAGHNGQHFFLASEDGNYLLNVGGQMQIRYIYNHARHANHPLEGSADEIADSEGFQIRRAKINFGGHVVDPKLTYGVTFSAGWSGGFGTEDNIGAPYDDPTGDVRVEKAWAAYDIADGWNLKGGRFKAPFLREVAVDSSSQLAVERSFVADYFSVYYTEGVQLSWTGEVGGLPIRAAAMLHDGSRAADSDYNADLTDVALAGRVELLVAGSWGQFDDFATWSGDEFGLMVGAGVDWENAKTGGVSSDTNNYDVLKWTADVSLEVPDFYGFNAFAAVVGQHLTSTFPAGSTGSVDQYGFVAQAGIFVQPEKWDIYARYEYLNFNGFSYVPNVPSQTWDTNEPIDNEIQIVTVGTNYYIKKHEAKFTLDVVWVCDPMEVSNSGSGIAWTEARDQVAVRAQFQLLF